MDSRQKKPLVEKGLWTVRMVVDSRNKVDSKRGMDNRKSGGQCGLVTSSG